MDKRKGFTLMEIIIAAVILGFLTSMAIPSFTTMLQQGYARNAFNNMNLIYAAQKNYYLANGKYCIDRDVQTGINYTCGDNLADLNTNLNLSIPTDNNYTYHCYWNSPNLVCAGLHGGTNQINPSFLLISTYSPAIRCLNVGYGPNAGPTNLCP